MYEFLDQIPKAPREMTTELPYLVGKKKLGFLFKKTWVHNLTQGDIAYCAVVQSADTQELKNGETGYSGMGVYIYTRDEKYMKDAKFLKEIADKMREIRFKSDELTESEKPISEALNNTSTPVRDFVIPTDLTNGVTCYMETSYLNGSCFEEDYVPQIYPILLGKAASNDGTYFQQQIDVKKYRELSGK